MEKTCEKMKDEKVKYSKLIGKKREIMTFGMNIL